MNRHGKSRKPLQIYNHTSKKYNKSNSLEKSTPGELTAKERQFKMNTYFYIRVSTKDQNTIRQEEKASGKNVTDRPILDRMMDKLKSGDKLIVDAISRFARNTKDLLDLVEQLNNKGVIFVSLKESIDTTTPTGIFMLTVFRAVAQLEREYSRERQAEGIAVAKKAGVYKGRKPIAYPKQWDSYYIK